jgi:hypothetical protein
MAQRIQALFRLVADTYDGRAERLWTEGARTGPRSLAGSRRSRRIFLALLGGTTASRAPAARSRMSRTPQAGPRVRAFKRESKAAARATGADARIPSIP